MPATSLPVNLTAAALEQSGPTGIPSAPLLLRPHMRCDQLDGSALQAQGQAAAARDEVYVVVAGFGGMRCEDGSTLEVTAGDVVYVSPGTSRGFEALSRNFSALLLTFSATMRSTDPS
jgi:hypothetical protein